MPLEAWVIPDPPETDHTPVDATATPPMLVTVDTPSLPESWATGPSRLIVAPDSLMMFVRR